LQLHVGFLILAVVTAPATRGFTGLAACVLGL